MQKDPMLNHIMQILTTPPDIDITPPTCIGCERETTHVNAVTHLCDDCDDAAFEEKCRMADTPFTLDD